MSTTSSPTRSSASGDVTVGTVTKIVRQDWHALVTMGLDGDVSLPANSTVTLGQTALLDSLHIAIGAADRRRSEGRLRQGSLIPRVR